MTSQPASMPRVDLQLDNHKLEWYNMYMARTNSKGVRYNNSINTEYIGSDTYTQDDETLSLADTDHLRHTSEGARITSHMT